MQVAVRGKFQLLLYPAQDLLVFYVLGLLDLLDLLLYLISVPLFLMVLSILPVCAFGTRPRRRTDFLQIWVFLGIYLQIFFLDQFCRFSQIID